MSRRAMLCGRRNPYEQCILSGQEETKQGHLELARGLTDTPKGGTIAPEEVRHGTALTIHSRV